MIRDDGSVRSAHAPTWDNRYQLRDYGLFRGVVRGTVFPEDEFNDSGKDTPNEVLYDIMLIGGDRDGQIFSNARLMRTLGGFANYEEITLKHLEGTSQADPASPAAAADPSISSIPDFNGDVVYIQFMNGDLNMPVIVGMGYHQKAGVEASEGEGPRYRRKYNGIYTEITRDGEFTWSKDNGAFVPFSANASDPLYPFVSQFAPLPGQEQAVKATLDNEYNFGFTYLSGLSVAISGLDDSFAFTAASGAKLSLAGGTADAFTATTALGTAITVAGGATDAITLGVATGASVKVEGLSDAISITSKFGDSLSVSAARGIQASTPSGTALSMKNGTIVLSSAGDAALVLKKDGTIQLGNSGIDVLKDVLQAVIQTLSTESAAGFGAPLNGVATYTQLLAKIKILTGG